MAKCSLLWEWPS